MPSPNINNNLFFLSFFFYFCCKKNDIIIIIVVVVVVNRFVAIRQLQTVARVYFKIIFDCK